MVLFEEKRKRNDRRCQNDGPPQGSRERRKAHNRRQTVIAEISLNEWVKSYLRFQKHMASKARRQEAAKQASSGVSAHSISDWTKPQGQQSSSSGYSQPPGNSRFSQDSQPPVSGF